MLDKSAGLLLTLDFPSHHLEQVQATLNSFDLPYLLGWEVPRRSPAFFGGAPPDTASMGLLMDPNATDSTSP